MDDRKKPLSGGGGGLGEQTLPPPKSTSAAYQSNYAAEDSVEDGRKASHAGGGHDPHGFHTDDEDGAATAAGCGGAAPAGDEPLFAGGSAGGGPQQGPVRAMTAGVDQLKNMVASVKGETFKLSVLKATSADELPPKEKHVRTIITALQMGGMVLDRSTPVGSVYMNLKDRMRFPDWAVVIKCLTVFHHIFHEGNEGFVNHFAAEERATVDVRRVMETNVRQSRFAPFARSYSQHLLQWCAMKHAIQFPPRKVVGNDHEIFVMARYAELGPRGIFRELPILLDTMDVLVQVRLQEGLMRTMFGPSVRMLIKDATYVWLAVSRCMLNLVEEFFDADRGIARTSFEFYERYQRTVPKVKNFFRLLSDVVPNTQLPPVNVMASDLGQTMEEYLGAENGGGSRRGRPDVVANGGGSRPKGAAAPPPPLRYEPPPGDYFSESDPEPEQQRKPVSAPPATRRRKAPAAPPSSSSSDSSESEEEVASPMPAPVSAPPPMTTVARAFDPFTDILGMQQMTVVGGPGGGGGGGGGVPTSGYPHPQQQQQAMYQQPGFQNSSSVRVESIKSVMNGVQQQQPAQVMQTSNGQVLLALPPTTAVNHHPQPQQHAPMMGGGDGGGGLAGVYAQMQAAQMQRSQRIQQQQQHQQQQQQQLQQAQAAMMTQNAAAYTSQYPVNMVRIAAQNPHIYPYQTATGQFFQTNAGGMPIMAATMGPQVPAMQAAPVQGQYRIQVGAPQFVNASDVAFRGLDNGMRRS